MPNSPDASGDAVNRLGLALIGAAMVVGAGAPSLAAELTKAQEAEAIRFAINNDIFTLQHEIGHLLVGEFELPVLGREEDAADSFASVSLIERQTDEADQVLIDSADGWDLSDAASDNPTYEDADFYDEHSLDIQRAYQTVCFMVGAAPDVFGEVADAYGIDADRQESCGDDYTQAATSWNGLLAPHLRAGGKGASITVRYEPADKTHAEAAKWLKEAKILETAASWVEATYALPRDLTFTAKLCDEENAFYSYDERGITFCYEMTQFLYDLDKQDLLHPTAN